MAGKIRIRLLLLLPVPLIYWLIYEQLNSTGGWLMIAFYSLIPLFAVITDYPVKRKKRFQVLGILSMISLAVLLVGEILFLPYMAYELWFDLFNTGLERGMVSHLFVKLGAYLTAIFCWIVCRQIKPFEALKKAVYLPFFFLFILWPTILTGLLVLVTLFWSRFKKENIIGLTLLLIVAFPIGLTGMKTEPKGASFIDNSSNNLIVLMTEWWPSLPILYDIPLYGESLSHSIETGGRPVLTSNTIMVVEGIPDDQIYLRNRIYAYPGDHSEARDLSDLIQNTPPQNSGDKIINIRIRTDYINMLPYTEKTTTVSFQEKFYHVDGQDYTIIPDPPLFLDNQFTLIEEKEKPLQLVDDIASLDRFRNPGFVPSVQMTDLALNLADVSTEKTASNIRNYLFDNYVYTLETKEQDNYTEFFLFNSGEGYCLHFASAFVALARINGIPCRFVEGYLVNFPSEEEYWEYYGDVPSVVTAAVTGLSSHVWPEIYLEDRGWVKYEATAPFYREDSRIQSDSLTRRQLARIQGNDLQEEPNSFRYRLSSFYILLIPFVFLLFYLFKGLLSHLHHYGKKTSFVIKRFIRWAARSGVPSPDEKGWVIWGEETIGFIPESDLVIQDSLPLILKARYSPDPLNEKEKNRLHSNFIKFQLICKKHKKA